MPVMSGIEQVFCRSLPWRSFSRRLVFPWSLGTDELRGIHREPPKFDQLSPKSEVLVTGIQMADNGDGPVEQITLSFGEIGFDYTPQTARGGAGTPVKVNWNVRTTQVT